MNCRVCTTRTRPFLTLPTAQLDEPFLDVALRNVLPELQLARCTDCGCIWATDARDSDQVMLKAYERLNVSYFDGPVPLAYREFYKRLELLLEKSETGPSILDVGCGDGNFLATLSDRWLKRGLEPSQVGAKLSKRKNLDVSCGTLETNKQLDVVDVISALDVIEHVADPHQFMLSIKKNLKPSGMVLLFTGDAGSRTARMAGPHWSYLRWCGHISVFSASGLIALLQSHGFEVVSWRRLEHPCSPGFTAWWRVHLLEPARRVWKQKQSWYPFWKDHQLIIARLK